MFRIILICHMGAFLAGYLLDLLIGDPYSMPHPVKIMGKIIVAMEKKWNSPSPETARQKGLLMVLILTASSFITSGVSLAAAYMAHPLAGAALEAFITYQVLAAKSLRRESMKVYRELEKGDLKAARSVVSMIVGRDTDVLDESGVARAAVETVAENASDGIIAPMLYTAIGGPALGMWYKAINTMDSMVGYKNERFRYFGRASAKLDDAVNLVPARLTAWLMIISCLFAGKTFKVKEAVRIYRRDRHNHASPNSAHTESVCAGALGIRLGGDASYFGKIYSKPTIGDAKRPVENEDIKRVNRLMYMSVVIFELVCLAVMAAILLCITG